MLLYKNPEQKILETVEQTIRRYHMLESGDSVLAGISGGADSVALLYILFTLASRLSLRLGIAHLNHCLRQQDSDNDAEFVLSLANQFNLPYYIEKQDVEKYRRENRLSPEEAAREVRYQFYEDVAEKQGFNKIATGHHGDDNAELVLMYLLRGSGPAGISGIPPVRDKKYIRPLIHLTRDEIITFLNAVNLTYVTDSTNQDIRYLRNRIRGQLIPMLKASYHPRITETLNRFSAIVRSEDEWSETIVAPIFENCISAAENGKIALSVPKLTGLHTAAQRRILRKAIARIKGDLRGITYTHTEALLNLLRNSAEGSIDLPGDMRAERKEATLLFLTVQLSERTLCRAASFEYRLSVPETVFIKETGAYLKFSEAKREDIAEIRSDNCRVAWFDRDRIRFPIIIRNFRPGDRFTPLGMTGTQKIKKYFINNKVPKEERVKCPLLVCQGKILWIAGHRMGERAKVLPWTQNLLKAELFLANP